MDRFGVKIKGIVRHKDEYLIVKKWYDDRIEDPYQWEFFDIHLQEGMTPEEQCLTYIQESTGIYARVTDIPYIWTYKLGDYPYLGIVFLCDLEEEEVVFLSEELVEYKWVKAEDLGQYIGNKTVLADMANAGIL